MYRSECVICRSLLHTSRQRLANIVHRDLSVFTCVFASFLERIVARLRLLHLHNLRVYTHNVGVHSDTPILLCLIMTYSIHAGGISEPAPERKGSLYLHGVDPETAKKQGEEHAWYDFFEQAVSTDRQGNIDIETTGCIHPASRTSGADTAFRPAVKNMAPRKANWTQSETNTQKEHRK